MEQHSHHHHHHDNERHGPDHGTGLAELLDLDAEVLGSYLDQVTEWFQQHAPALARRIIDVGAGTGAGSLALARHFPAAEVVAVDKSASMLERLRTAVLETGHADRVSSVHADVDGAWPDVGAPDIVWMASSLHEFTDQARVLRDAYTALNPGGLLVLVEMDDLPFFLPADIGQGRPGLEARCHEAAAQAKWNAHPDWGPHMQRAGFEIAAQRSFTIEANPAPTSAGRFAHKNLSSFRSALHDQLEPDDLDTLDQLLAEDNPDGVLRRSDLVVRGSRTAWAGRRP